ncbi:MAG TPA: hypothetical protein VGO09_08815 [Flavisolibacter sp.]|jgi:hypothetical protein|nr:hypothetical protein [Flavisolibacter sp.]
MLKESVQQQVELKAKELGISEEFILCALNILYRNKNMVNAIDNQTEMDDYIYRAIIKQSIEKRKALAEKDLNNNDHIIRSQAEKDLSVLSREELVTDPYFRAVLPLIVKVVGNEPILRLHASEATIIVLELADFKRRHRATSITEVIVKKCSSEIEKLFAESI